MRRFILFVTAFILSNTILLAQNIKIDKYYLNIDSSLKSYIKKIPGDTMNITAFDMNSKNKIQYHLLLKKPDAGIDYKILTIKPDTTQNFSIIIIDPITGQNKNDLTKDLMKRLFNDRIKSK
jgi:hypothetical protein